MYIFFSILIVIASILLVFFVIIQNSKGGGLAAGFSSSNQVMGVRKTTDFLEKATWTLAAIVVVGSIFASMSILSGKGGAVDSVLKEDIQNMTPAIDPNATAPFGTPVTSGEGEEEAPALEE
jgi:preprotein translocase subunit SecG